MKRVALPLLCVLSGAGCLDFSGTQFCADHPDICNTTLTGIEPQEGPAAGGTTLTITGTNFYEGRVNITVGGVPVTNVVLVSDKLLTAKTPPGTPGRADVAITGGDGPDATLADAFLYTACRSGAQCQTGQTCDASANGGAGVCKGCRTEANCGPETPVCDPAADNGAGVCKTCTASTGCSAPAAQCETSANGGLGACRVCTATAGCSGPTPICEVAANDGAGACRTCTATAGCGGSRPACEVEANGGLGACRTCTATAGCSSPTPYCDTAAFAGAGLCVSCTATAGCSGETPACNVAVGACVECTSSSHCSDGTPVCDPAAMQCRTCLADNSGCSPETPFCNVSTGLGTCYQCNGHGDCPATQDCSAAFCADPPATATTVAAEIAAVRAAIDGPQDPVLPISGAVVTYLKPFFSSPNDVAGFFVQATQTGPAIFVAVDPAGVVTVGDRISFEATAVATLSGGVREITALQNLVVLSSGHPVDTLRQDVSTATDLISGVADYESELVRLELLTSADFLGAAIGHVQAAFTTAGHTVPDSGLKLRVPTSVATALGLTSGCQLSVLRAPVWRFGQTQISPYLAGDLSVQSCPGPQVTGVIPLSVTQLAISFDRPLAASSLQTSGAQFSFTAGLTASAAELSATQPNVVLVTTSAQARRGPYEVTVANTLTNLSGQPMDTAATVAFSGFAAPASLLINEVNPNVLNGKDLIELVVTASGALTGMTVEMDVSGTPPVMAQLPDIDVAAGDLIVVHLSPASPADSLQSETTGKAQFPVSGFPANYDNAWDVAGLTTHITFSNRILTIRGVGRSFVDAVPFSVAATAPAFAYISDVQSLQAQGLWLPSSCNGTPCTATSFPTVKEIAVDWSAMNPSSSFSVSRIAGSDTRARADWNTPTTSTFGAANP